VHRIGVMQQNTKSARNFEGSVIQASPNKNITFSFDMILATFNQLGLATPNNNEPFRDDLEVITGGSVTRVKATRGE